MRVLCVLTGAILLALAAPQLTHAGGVLWTLDGPKYGRTHRWYTDDCGKWERRVEHSCGDQRAIHRPSHPRHEQSKRCDVERASYYLRHPDKTPSGLRHLHGCDKYRRDWEYHEVTAPAMRGIVDQFRVLALNLKNNTLEALE